MRIFLQIVKNTWAETTIYRLNFFLWRLRMVIQILVLYFLWSAVFMSNELVMGYTKSMMLGYILLSNVVRTMVLSTKTFEIGEMIIRGTLSNLLLRPIHAMHYWASRDVADKCINAFFAVGEIVVLYFLLRPSIFIQSDVSILLMTIVAVFIGMIVYFWFSVVLGLLGFWSHDVWSPRFLSFVLIEFFAGGLFPLDILPKTLFTISQILPFTYFLYFPLKIYLGQVSGSAIILGYILAIGWAGVLCIAAQLIWHKGLAHYSAEGR